MLVLLLPACSGPTGEAADGEAGHAVSSKPPSRLEVGKTIYRQYCFSCHASGINGAPREGDDEAWARLAAKGDAELLRITRAGIAPFMPANGLCSTCSDEELSASIDYMMGRLEP